MVNGKIRVGIIGAGPVTQAIHLPTLARLSSTFEVVHIMDVDEDIARDVASFIGATYSTSAEMLLADPNVEVVAICSPGQFHVPQVLAAIAAGKKGVLCEKPLASNIDEVRDLEKSMKESGVPIVVGAMHGMDLGWLDAKSKWKSLNERARHVKVTAVLPPNANYEAMASQIITKAPHAVSPPTHAEGRAKMMRAAVLGLAVHSVPVIRHFIKGDVSVLHARLVAPFGYEIIAHSGDTTIEFFAIMQGTNMMDWRVAVEGERTNLVVKFPPSYVHAGSASSEFDKHGNREFLAPHPENGYIAEWQKLAGYVNGKSQSLDELNGYIVDFELTSSIAEQAHQLVLLEAE